MRPLDFVVDFPFPEAHDRKKIWRLLLLTEAPVEDDLDLDFLAVQFKLSRGAIRNCSLSAAFQAADEDSSIGMRHLVRAVAQEYGKQGRLTLESDFGRLAGAARLSHLDGRASTAAATPRDVGFAFVPKSRPTEGLPSCKVTDADFKNAIDIISKVIDAAGVLVVVVGLLAAAGAFAIGQARRDQRALAYRAFRQQVGKAILLGLEFLVAADIIRTVAVAPTFQGVGVLAVVVAVRTFLSFTLDVELEGRWPWQQRRTAQGPSS